MEHMSDRELWALAVDTVSADFTRLSRHDRLCLENLAETVLVRKEQLHSIIAAANAGDVCAGCGGECCRTGKYHFTVVDLLVYLVKGKALFTPRFEQQIGCPYLGPEGCLMEPGFRPFNCVSFNCDKVETLLATGDTERLNLLELELRQTYHKFEEHLGRRLMSGLLMNRNFLHKDP